MFRLLLGVLSSFLLAGALASLLVDGYQSFKVKQIVTTGVSTLLQNLIPVQYEAFLSFLNSRFPPNFTHFWLKLSKETPVFLVLSASAALILALQAKSKRKIGFSNR